MPLAFNVASRSKDWSPCSQASKPASISSKILFQILSSIVNDDLPEVTRRLDFVSVTYS